MGVGWEGVQTEWEVERVGSWIGIFKYIYIINLKQKEEEARGERSIFISISL